MKKILKMIGIGILSVIGLVLIVGIAFLNLSPQFGRAYDTETKKEYEKLDNYNDGKFVNKESIAMEIKWGKMLEFFKSEPSRSPSKDIVPIKPEKAIIDSPNDSAQLIWFGHSAFLLQMEGKNILLDPMFGQHASPHKWLGSPRYSKHLPIEIADLPQIDAVIISHDHYDHLDYPSIKELKSKVKNFYVPLGVGEHLRSWGIEEERIHEHNWWEENKIGNIQIVCTPARHFSGRGLFDRETTLWSSWVIKGSNESIFFSGDSGYGDHFKEIGEKHGPFDLSLMECGQYNEDWALIHMMPEQTAQAAQDLGSKVFIPIHWGAFTLALHTWIDPVERAKMKAKEINQRISTPQIGETIIVQRETQPNSIWWENYINL